MTSLRAESGGAPAPGQMRAARLHAYGAPPALELVPIPVPGPGEVLVRVLASVVTHLDLTVIGGQFAIRPELPHTPGLEAVGEIVAEVEPVGGAGPAAEAGSGVAAERAAGSAPDGRRATLVQLDGCVGLDRPGAWAEYVLAPADGVIALDPGADPLAELARRSPAATARDALFGAGSYRAGERVAITGASGACGMLTVALAAHFSGGGEVIACIRDRARSAGVPDGATVLIEGPEASGEPDGPIDLLVDYVGGADLPRRLRWLRPGGRAVLVGYTAGTEATLDIPNLLAAGVSIVAFNGLVTPPASLPDGAAPRLPPVPYESIAFEDIPDACRRLPRGGLSGRLIAVL